MEDTNRVTVNIDKRKRKRHGGLINAAVGLRALIRSLKKKKVKHESR